MKKFAKKEKRPERTIHATSQNTNRSINAIVLKPEPTKLRAKMFELLTSLPMK